MKPRAVLWPPDVCVVQGPVPREGQQQALGGSTGSSPAAASPQPVRREVQDQPHGRAATCTG